MDSAWRSLEEGAGRFDELDHELRALAATGIASHGLGPDLFGGRCEEVMGAGNEVLDSIVALDSARRELTGMSGRPATAPPSDDPSADEMREFQELIVEKAPELVPLTVRYVEAAATLHAELTTAVFTGSPNRRYPPHRQELSPTLRSRRPDQLLDALHCVSLEVVDDGW